MKVLYIHQYFKTPKGVGGLRSYQMAQKLIENGHSVTMVCLSKEDGYTGLNTNYEKGKRSGIVHNIKVIEFKIDYSNYQSLIKRSIVFSKFVFRTINLVFTESYDIIFATSTPLTVGITGIIAKKIRKKKFIFEVRDLWPELPVAMGVIKNRIVIRILKIIEKLSYKNASKIYALAPGIKEGIIKSNIPKEKVELIPNGCDLDLFNPKILEKDFDNGIKRDDFVAAYTGAHGKANGLHVLLDIADELKKREIFDIKILMVGDGKLKPWLKNEAKKQNLDNLVFKDPVPKIEMPELLNKIDVGLMILDNIPAFYNGTSPNKFFDYIASGTPVLNNYPGWLAKLISDNNCGFVVNPGDKEAFIDRLIELKENKTLMSKLGSNARHLAESMFDRNEQAKKFVHHMEQVYKN